MTDMELKGRITIDKTNDNESNYIKISIIDEDAGIRFCAVKMSMSNFAHVITGGNYINCNLDISDLDKVGMKYEDKIENVKRIHDQSVEKTIQPYEIDGWIGRKEDAQNRYNIVEHNDQYNIYRVLFYRWIEKDECFNKNNELD